MRRFGPELQKAQVRVRSAREAVDEAMYADVVDEELLAASVRELAEAQNEVLRIRFRSELAVRKILTPGQLAEWRRIKTQAKKRRMIRQQQNRRNRMNRRQRPRP